MGYLNKLKNQVSISKDVFIAQGAIILGNVTIGYGSSIWFNAVLRGDADSITIGERSNIQDLAMVHVDPGYPTKIGNDVIIGHKAIIHGATIDDNTLIGMGATILNGATIGKFCIIGAGALVTEGMQIPDGSLVMGVPAKIVKQVTDAQRQKIINNALAYYKLSRKYLDIAIDS